MIPFRALRRHPARHSPLRLLPGWMVLLALSGAATGANGQLPLSSHFRLEPLRDGVYAALPLPGGQAICNAGIIDMGQYAVVIDPFLSPDAAADLRRAAEELTGHPVRYVVNTHAHSDHVRGNLVFAGSAEIISTPASLAAMATRGPAEIREERSAVPARLAELDAKLSREGNPRRRSDLALQRDSLQALLASERDSTLTLPTVTIDRRMTLRGTRRSIDLVVFDGGHTASDLVVFLPAEKIVFAGDLLFVESHPWLGDGDPDKLLQTLRQLRTTEIDCAVPGHGPVGDADHFTAMIRYVQDLEAIVRDALARGMGEGALVGTPVPAAYTEWHAEWFFLPNLRFLYGRAASRRNP